jgi:hypothetical protein
MKDQQFMRRLRDLHEQIAELSAKLKTAVAAGDHEREAKVGADISRLLDEIDRIRAGLDQKGAGWHSGRRRAAVARVACAAVSAVIFDRDI